MAVAVERVFGGLMAMDNVLIRDVCVSMRVLISCGWGNKRIGQCGTLVLLESEKVV